MEERNVMNAVTVKLSLLIAALCMALAGARGLAAESGQSVVYEWNAASFRPAGGHKAEAVKRANGAIAQRITATRNDWNNFIIIPEGTLKGGRQYTAILKYEIVSPTVFPGTFYMFARSKSLGQHRDIWQTWLGDARTSGVARLSMSLRPADDWMFYVGCKGPGVQIIDSLQIVEGSGFEYLPAAQAAVSAPAGATTQAVAIGASKITIDPPAAKQERVLTATEFGLVADDPQTSTTIAVATKNFAAVKRAIDACREQDASRLVFPKGVYRFYSDEAIAISKLSDVVIDGQGSEFIFEKLHPNVAAVSVIDCTRCVIKDLRLDWDWTVTPLASLCRVMSVSDDGLNCELMFPDLSEKELELVQKAPWKQIFPMDEKTFRPLSAVRLSPSVSQFTPLPGGVLRVTFKQPMPLVKGDTYCVRHQYYEMSAFRIGDSSHLLFDNVTIYSMPGMGWVSRGEMSHWGFRDCRIVRREGSRRPLTATADGFHVTESLGNLLLENCEFTGLGDDCVNIHDNCFQGVQRNDDHTLTLVGNNRWRFRVAAGHTIELFRADYSPIGFRSRIDAVVYKGDDTILTLTEKLPADLSRQSIVVNHHYRSANVRIVNSRFHNTSGRGLLTDAKDLTVENCIFDHTFGQAVQLAIDIVPPLWAEGLPTSNVVLRGNVFDGVNAAGRTDNAAICTFTRWPAGATMHTLYSDVLIERNRFVDTHGPAVAIRNCQNVVVRDNTIDTVKLANPTAFAAAILAAYSSDLTLSDNRWEAGVSVVKPGVLYDPQTTSNVAATNNVVRYSATQP